MAQNPRRSGSIYSSVFDQSWHVPVYVKPTDRSDLIWLNEDLARTEGLQKDYAKEIAQSLSVKTEPAQQESTYCLWADIYGDRYGLSAYGSGRCVSDGRWQAKGCGPTPLVSDHADENHCNGLISLEESIRETIWGELLNHFLPHGAIRTLALVDQGQTIQWTQNNQRLKERAALLVRAAPFRVAHLLPFAFPNRASRPNLLQDNSLRVRRIWELFSAHLAEEGLSAEEWWLRCVDHHIEQYVWAWVHHVGHGGMLSSNMTENGAWMDFGSVSFVPDYRAHLLVEFTHPTGREHVMLFLALADLQHELLRAGHTVRMTEAGLRVHMRKACSAAFSRACLSMLTGASGADLGNLADTPEIRNVLNSIANALRLRNRDFAGNIYSEAPISTTGDSALTASLPILAKACAQRPERLSFLYSQHVSFMASYYRPNFKAAIERSLNEGKSAKEIIDEHRYRLQQHEAIRNA